MAIDTQQVHTAMEEAGGNAVNAAKALGVAPIWLYNVLHKNPELRIRWTRSKENKKPVDQAAAAINKPLEPVPISDVEALQRANTQLRKGLEAIGLSGEKLEQGMVIQEFARRQVGELMGFMAGSIAKQSVDIEAEIQCINKRLSGFVRAGQTWVESVAKLSIKEESMLRKDRQELYDLRIKSYDRAMRAQTAMALVNMKAADKNKLHNGRRVPGFAPLQQQTVIEQ